MTSANVSTVDLDVFYQHVGFGLSAILTNMVMIFTFIRNRTLMKKSSFIFTLVVGDLMEGVGLTGSGLTRIVRSFDGTLGLPIQPTYCLASFVSFFLLGIQLSATMFTLLGLERFAAVYFFSWFHVNWSNKLGWKLSTGGFLYCLISVAVAWFFEMTRSSRDLISNECKLHDVLDRGYLIYNHFFAISAGSLAITASLSALVTFCGRKRRLLNQIDNCNLRQRIAKQLQVSKIVSCATVLHFVLVVIPSLVVMLGNGFRVPLPVHVGAWALRLITCRSIFNLFVNVFVNREFRQALFKAFGAKILTISPQQQTPQRLFELSQFARQMNRNTPKQTSTVSAK